MKNKLKLSKCICIENLSSSRIDRKGFIKNNLYDYVFLEHFNSYCIYTDIFIEYINILTFNKHFIDIQKYRELRLNKIL